VKVTEETAKTRCDHIYYYRGDTIS